MVISAEYYQLTAGNETYRINKEGFISRKCVDYKYSGQWKALALVRHHNNGSIKEAINFKDWLQLKPHFDDVRIYGNGKPQWYLQDLDHGTLRQWGNPVLRLDIITL